MGKCCNADDDDRLREGGGGEEKEKDKGKAREPFRSGLIAYVGMEEKGNIWETCRMGPSHLLSWPTDGFKGGFDRRRG